LPELPAQVLKRFIEVYKFDQYQAEVLSEERYVVHFLDKALSIHNNTQSIANWISTELFGRLNKEGLSVIDSPVSPENLASLVKLIDDEVVSGKIAKSVFDEMFLTGGSPEAIVEDKGWKQISDRNYLTQIVTQVVEANPKQVEEFRGGKEKMFGFFIGKIMKETEGKANPNIVNELLTDLLKK